MPIEVDGAHDRFIERVEKTAGTSMRRSAWWYTRPFAVMGSRDKSFDKYAVVHMAQPDGLDVQIGKAAHQGLE